MSRFIISRRKLLKGGAALGALGVTSGIMPVRLARAADLTVGILSHTLDKEIQAAALRTQH